MNLEGPLLGADDHHPAHVLDDLPSRSFFELAGFEERAEEIHLRASGNQGSTDGRQLAALGAEIGCNLSRAAVVPYPLGSAGVTYVTPRVRQRLQEIAELKQS